MRSRSRVAERLDAQHAEPVGGLKRVERSVRAGIQLHDGGDAPELSPQRASDTVADAPGVPRPRSSVPSPSAGALAMRHMLTATSVL